MSNPREAVIKARSGSGRRSQRDAVSVRLVQGGARRTLAGQHGVLASHSQTGLNGASQWES